MQQTENQRVKILRKELKLSQGDFAKEIGREQGSISDIERGRNSVDGIVELLKLRFDVNPEWLKNGIGQKFLENKKATTNETDIGMAKLIQSLEKIIATQEGMISDQKDFIANQKDMISILKKENIRLNDENDLLRSKLGNINTGSKAG